MAATSLAARGASASLRNDRLKTDSRRPTAAFASLPVHAHSWSFSLGGDVSFRDRFERILFREEKQKARGIQCSHATSSSSKRTYEVITTRNAFTKKQFIAIKKLSLLWSILLESCPKPFTSFFTPQVADAEELLKEHDACGVGLIASLKNEATHKIVEQVNFCTRRSNFLGFYIRHVKMLMSMSCCY